MDQVVALSALLRARQHHANPSSLELDAIPYLTRSLEQVHADSTRLLSARVASSAAADASPSATPVHPAALRLFASVGFEVDRLRRAVAAVDTAATFIEHPSRAADPHRHPVWLAPRLQDDARLAMNAALRSAARDVATADLAAVNRRLRNRLAAALGSSPSPRPEPASITPSNTPRTPRTPRTPTSAHAPGPFGSTAGVGAGSVALATGVHERYVDAMRAIALHGDAPSAPFLLHEVAAAIMDNAHFVEALAVVASVARHTPANTQPSADMVVWGARVVLEDQFAECVPGLPQKPRLAAPAAVVGPIREYVAELYKQGRLGTVPVPERPVFGFGGRGRATANVPLWPQVYFCMRVGNMQAALSVLNAADWERFPTTERLALFVRRFLQGRHHAMARFLNSGCGTRGGDGTTNMEDDDALAADVPMTPGYLVSEADYVSLEKLYKDVAWSSEDPFLRACVVLLLRLELLSAYGGTPEVHNVHPSQSFYAKHPPKDEHQRCSPALSDSDLSLLFGSVEDYMWLRLWLCRTPIETEAISLLSGFSFVTLQGVQGNMLSCGNAHFDPNGNQPLLYPFVLVCSGLYEEAVSYLTTHQDENLMHSGVHLAVALYHLQWHGDDDAFHSTLLRYVSLFSRLFPVEAAVYLMTIRSRAVLQKLLGELVLSTGEYEVLLGNIRNGEPSPGGLGNLLSSANVPLPSGFSEQDLNVLTRQAAGHGAAVASSRGDYATASDLYMLSDNTVASIEMVVRNLAEVVDKQTSPKRALAVANARRVLETMETSDSVSVPGVIRHSLKVLLKMSTVFEEFWAWRDETAWSALRNTGIIPMATEDMSRCQRDLSSTVEKYSACVQRCARELLRVALTIAERALQMNCVSNECARRSSDIQRPRGPNRDEVRSICVFAGLMGVSGAEVNEKIVRIEMLLS